MGNKELIDEDIIPGTAVGGKTGSAAGGKNKTPGTASVKGGGGGSPSKPKGVGGLGGDALGANPFGSDAAELSAPQWASTICPPSNLQDDDVTTPTDVIELVHAHGPKISDAHSTLAYNQDGNILYISSALCVIFDRDQQTQRFYSGHNRYVKVKGGKLG